MDKRKLTDEQQKAQEEQILNTPVNPTGEGEPEVVKALMSEEFVQMSNFDATQVALMLQELVRGQQSMISRFEDTHLQIAKLREHQDEVDKRIHQALESEKKEIADILNRAEKLKESGDRKDRQIANGAMIYQNAVAEARARNASDKVKFEQQLAAMPKETVISPGRWEQTREGMKLFDEEVRIKHKVWILPAGQAIEVPKAVADLLRTRRAGQLEQQQRKELLSKRPEQGKLAEEWNKIGGSKTQGIPLA